VRTLDVLPAEGRTETAAAASVVREAAERHRPRTERAVRGEITKLVCHDRLKDFFVPTFQLRQGAVVDLRWPWERRKKREIKHRDVARRSSLRTARSSARNASWKPTAARPGWRRCSASVKPTARVVVAGVSLDGRHTAGPCPLLLSGHADDPDGVASAPRAPPFPSGWTLLLERLQGIEEPWWLYANGAAQRVITERSPEQKELFIALDIETLAQQVGNTVLHP